jgi:circadian clock protein KaiC
MTRKVTINRLPTGVPGLDEILGGGLPEFSFNLIAGPPGCGKTTLAHQIMFALATPKRPALFMTVLGEPSIKMLRYQQQFEFFDSDKINQSVHFVNLSEEALTGDLAVVLARIEAEVKKHDPALVFVDSFRSVVMAGTAGASGATGSNAGNDLQLFMQQLAMLMTSWHATTFLIGEYFTETDANPVFTVADGLIWLRQSVQRNSMVRKLEIVKMRGQSTLAGLHSFRIGPQGVQVFAPAGAGNGKEPRFEAAGERVQTGIARLDEMLGGGLPRGYSMLVAGPSGSGKSILTASFMAEGVRRGETGVLVAFEQRPSPTRNRLMDKLIKTGKVGLVDTENDDISIDEVLYWLMKEVRRLKATRVVIDSLSGFELKLAPTYREDFRESMLRMVTTLAREGVTVLMTSELEDRYTDLRFSPYGTAFLTDAIVVQRYIELDSRLRRVMAVVKLRDTLHSNELREYHIDVDGIHVGDMLSDQEGLLGGRPTRRSAADGGAEPAGKSVRSRSKGTS